MSVISAIATDADNVQYLQNKKFAEQVKPIAGKFEVLRIEIGGVVMPLYYSFAELNNSTYFFPFQYTVEKELLLGDSRFAMNNFGGELSISLNA